MKDRIDILNLEWPNNDRDLHIVTPVLVFLEKKYAITFKTKSIFYGYGYIIKYRPRILLISNFGGANINHEIVKLAYNMGIKVISLISEGNVKKEACEQFLWGWNKDKKLYVDALIVWSNKSKNIFLERYPELKEKIFVSGATGFDRYSLLKFKNKSNFLNENKLEKYKKIIGIAAWGFDHYFGNYYKKHETYYVATFGEKQIHMHRNDLYQLQTIYKHLIKNNSDTLFILRYHPGTIDFEKNEFFGLDKLDNVFISNKKQNSQYQISDLINVSDLWIGYETTTALEAWLMGKTTFLINPTQSSFIRENVHKGSPIVKNENEAQLFIDKYFIQGNIEEFRKLKHYRDDIIKNVIEYDDGNNHQRVAEKVMNILNNPVKEKKFYLKIYFEAIKQIIVLVLSKTILKKRWPNLDYKSNFAKKYQDMYKKAINV